MIKHQEREGGGGKDCDSLEGRTGTLVLGGRKRGVRVLNFWTKLTWLREEERRWQPSNAERLEANNGKVPKGKGCPWERDQGGIRKKKVEEGSVS